MLVRELPAKSRLATALNGGQPVWSQTEHLLADLWVLLSRAFFSSKEKPLPKDFDHPVRAAMKAKATSAAKQNRIARLRAVFEERRRTYGMEA